MDITNKKLIIFDLDGTLAPSKSRLEDDMAVLFTELLKKRKVAVISGGGYKQFMIQFLNSLPVADCFSNLYLLPTSGTRFLVWKQDWKEVYVNSLTKPEKEKILNVLNSAYNMSGIPKPETLYGEQIEDRDSQITFSALGQSAPLEKKMAWDPDRSKRETLLNLAKEKLPEFDVRIGGSTSIDVTRRGLNKGYGIRKLEEFFKLTVDDIIFIGDAIFPGGDDYPAKAMGVDCISVKGPAETKELIKEWVK